MTARGVQGWQPDPFGVHEARYFSAAGQPTKLVRDRGAESYDEPPSGPEELAAARVRMSAPSVAYAPQGYVPVPRAYPPPGPPPHGGPPYRPAAARRLGRRAGGVVGFVASAIILVAIATGAVLVALTLLHPKKAGAGDAALVTQAATKTLQQRTANVVISATAAAGSTTTREQGTAAFDLSRQLGTLDMTIRSSSGVTAVKELFLGNQVYLATSANGRSLLPAGKAWVAEPVSGQSATGPPGSSTAAT